jgi:hypothetical protein
MTLSRIAAGARTTESNGADGGPSIRSHTPNGEYIGFLKKLSVESYVDRTMILLCQIDPARVAFSVTPIPLARMVGVVASADQPIVY